MASRISLIRENSFHETLQITRSAKIVCLENLALYGISYIRTLSLFAGENFLQVGENMAFRGENLLQVGENMAFCGENFLQVGENMAFCGENLLQVGENMAFCGENFLQVGENMAFRGENLLQVGENMAFCRENFHGLLIGNVGRALLHVVHTKTHFCREVDKTAKFAKVSSLYGIYLC